MTLQHRHDRRRGVLYQLKPRSAGAYLQAHRERPRRFEETPFGFAVLVVLVLAVIGEIALVLSIVGALWPAK
jgi:hypothetical protein